MTNGTHSKRACVMIVPQDFDFGIKLADRLAAHGYQAVLVRSVETAIDECRDLRPQVVFIGAGRSEPTPSINLRELFRVIEATCLGASVVIMGDHPGGNLMQVVTRGAVRHVLVRPIDVTHIGRLLQAELNRTAASADLPSPESDQHEGWAVEQLSREQAVHGDATAWIG